MLLQRLGYQGEPIVALDEALAAFLRADLTPKAASLASTEHTMLLASVRTCCLRGSTGAQGASAPPLPYPTDLGMLVGRVLPRLLWLLYSLWLLYLLWLLFLLWLLSLLWLLC